MGASGSKADVLVDAVRLLQAEELAPAGEGAAAFSVFWTAACRCVLSRWRRTERRSLTVDASSWDELLDALSGDDLRLLRERHPRNLAYLVSQARTL